jgi:phage gpG-like protein
MPTYIKIQLAGGIEVTKRINGVVGSLKDMRKGFKKIGDDFRETEEKIFNGQGAYGSRGRWSELTPLYRNWKSVNYPGKPILQMTGSLKNSLTKKTSGHVEIITKNSITLGSTNPTFIYHQKGTRKMRARPPIIFTEYQGRKWVNIMKDHIMEGIKK